MQFLYCGSSYICYADSTFQGCRNNWGEEVETAIFNVRFLLTVKKKKTLKELVTNKDFSMWLPSLLQKRRGRIHFYRASQSFLFPVNSLY